MSAKTDKALRKKVFECFDTFFKNKANWPKDQHLYWMPSYPYKDEDAVRVYKNKATVRISNDCVGISLEQLSFLCNDLGAKDVKLEGAGDDYGGSIGHQAWLEVTLKF